MRKTITITIDDVDGDSVINVNGSNISPRDAFRSAHLLLQFAATDQGCSCHDCAKSVVLAQFLIADMADEDLLTTRAVTP